MSDISISKPARTLKQELKNCFQEELEFEEFATQLKLKATAFIEASLNEIERNHANLSTEAAAIKHRKLGEEANRLHCMQLREGLCGRDYTLFVAN